MIVLKPYQEKAVDSLLENVYDLLQKPGARHRMVLDAPTGAGKTVSMAAFLNKFCEELPDKLELSKRNATFIWIAPNQLHLQSYSALKNYFAELRSIKPIQFEDVTDDCLKPNEILFLNWESINKKKNIYVRENEQGKNLYSYVNAAKLQDTEVIVIMDEEHLYVDATKTKEVLQNIYAKVEIGVSATPQSKTKSITIIKRSEVVKAEMIKEQIVLNPALDAHDQEGRTLNQVLMDLALQKREQIAEAYKKLGVKINPLLLIQLPNDTKEDETLDDKVIKEEVLQYLEAYKGITINNHKLAVWLSGRKDNLPGIEQKDNLTEVLLFKQAIAFGWDCPRAAVLLIFRANKSEIFTIQTVGRILRMPEQKHYTNALLNNGYVYTDLSKKMIKVVQDDMDYIVQNKALRIEDYKPVALHSAYINTRLVRNRLNSKFKRALFETAEKLWSINKDLSDENIFIANRDKLKANFVEIDVKQIEIPVPKNVLLSGEVEVVTVEAMERFAKTQDELNKIFIQFCRHNCGGYAVVDSTPVLEMSLKLLCEEYFQFNEYESVKIILYAQNEPRFVELIIKAMELYAKMQEEKAKRAKKEVEKYTWDVPPERIYNDNYAEHQVYAHALEPFYELINASNPEKNFEEFLESNKQHLNWWYKNGESAKEHFAIPYIDYTGKQSLFYVDFVMQAKIGITCLFDTKTSGSDAANVHLKHNALIEYMEKENESGKNILGGVIIPKQTGEVFTWHFCRNRITNTKDITGWDIFNPASISIKETA